MHDPLIYVISPYENQIGEGLLQDGPRLRLLQIAESLSVNGCRVVFLSKSDSILQTPVNSFKFEFWKESSELKRLMSRADVIVASYAALGINEIILSTIKENQILIADAIVPILAENSARKIQENINKEVLVQFLNRSRLILVSSMNLAKFYDSFLFQNEETKPTHDKYFVFPFTNMERNSITAKIDKSPKLSLVHYGGVYPWFGVGQFEEFVDRFPHSSSQIRLTLAGLVNPNVHSNEVSNTNERIIRASLSNPNIIVKPWIPPNLRLKYLQKFDAAIFFNNPDNFETSISWRTRYADFLSAKLPLLVNSFDPFSTLLHSNGLCKIFEKEHLVNSLRSPSKIRHLKEELNMIKNSSLWDRVQNTISSEKLGPLLKERIVGVLG